MKEQFIISFGVNNSPTGKSYCFAVEAQFNENDKPHEKMMAFLGECARQYTKLTSLPCKAEDVALNFITKL